jgi:DNA-binding NtrC family response regulator
MNLLLVDPRQRQQPSLATLLGRIGGVSTVAAATPAEARALLDGAPVYVGLVGLGVGREERGEALQLVAELRARGAGVLLLVATEEDLPGLEEAVAASGASGYLLDEELRALGAALEVALGLSRGRDGGGGAALTSALASALLGATFGPAGRPPRGAADEAAEARALARALLGSAVPDKLQAAEDALVGEAMRLAEGNKSRAARLLGVHRKAVERRLERTGREGLEGGGSGPDASGEGGG